MPHVELYIADQLCDLQGDEKIEVDYTIFDVTKIESRGGARSYSFELPKTDRNKTLLENPEMVNNLSQVPYTRLKCRCYIDGVDSLIRFCEVASVKDSYSIRLYGGNSDLFASIKDKKLSELDMSEFDHYWILANVANGLARTVNEGYVYPLIDYHLDSPNAFINDYSKTIRADFMLPALYYNYVLQKIFDNTDYTWVNTIEDETEQVIIPASKLSEKNIHESKYTAVVSYSQNIVLSDTRAEIGYTANVGQFIIGDIITDDSYGSTGEIYYISGGAPGTAGVIRIKGATIVPPGFQGGLGHTISVGAKYGTINTVTTLQTPSAVIYNPDVLNQYSGTWYSLPYTPYTLFFVDIVPITLTMNIAVVNNTNLNSIFNILIRTASMGDAYFNIQPIQVGVGTTQLSFSITTGDTLTLVGGGTYVFGLENFTDFIQMSFKIKAGAEITIDYSSTLSVVQNGDVIDQLEYGQLININSLLPDITQLELLKNYMQMFCLLPVIDEPNKTVTLVKFDDILLNVPNCYDWSNKLDLTEEHEITFIDDNYGQTNNFKYKQDGDEPKPIGTDGVIIISNSNLEKEKDVIELVFAGTNSVTRCEGLQVDNIGIFENGEYKSEREPRVLVADIQTYPYSITLTDSGATSYAASTFSRPYFIDSTKAFNLGFGNNLLANYYDLLSNVLSGVKLVKILVRLNVSDISQLDFTRPVFIQKYEAYFYISSIKGFSYTESKSTLVELVKLNING